MLLCKAIYLHSATNIAKFRIFVLLIGNKSDTPGFASDTTMGSRQARMGTPGLTFVGSKHYKRDDLPHYGLHWLCVNLLLRWKRCKKDEEKYGKRMRTHGRETPSCFTHPLEPFASLTNFCHKLKTYLFHQWFSDILLQLSTYQLGFCELRNDICCFSHVKNSDLTDSWSLSMEHS